MAKKNKSKKKSCSTINVEPSSGAGNDHEAGTDQPKRQHPSGVEAGNGEAETNTDGHMSRWVSLADRLNPNRAGFDPKFKEEWKTLDKASKKRIIAEDKKKIHELQQRACILQKELPFEADINDHCETSKTAYGHIVPFLNWIAHKLNKNPTELRIYDPYYCAGAVKRHLKELGGFGKVHNQPDDFYKVIANNKVPPHDIIVTNPPYSGDHFHKLQNFLLGNKKPHLLLIPDHFQVDDNKYVVLTPKERYHYWTPRGLRPDEDNKKGKHRNLILGNRNSPFPSRWCISLEPILTKKELLDMVIQQHQQPKQQNQHQQTELVLADGCTLQEKDNNKKDSNNLAKRVSSGGTKFRQREEEADLEEEDDDGGSSGNKRKKRRKKKRKKNYESSNTVGVRD